MATLPVSDTRKNTVTLGSSTAGPINVGFRLFSEDIRVFVDDAETTAFTLTATFEDGYEDDATITFDSAQDAGAKIDIISDYDPERAADYLASDRQLASKLNSELGHLWGLVADLKRDVARASLVPVDAPELNLAIPNPTESATLIGRADGKGWKTGPTADEISGAQAAAEDVDAALADFETRYLGAKASDPSTDNEGNALTAGALYYDTTSNEMRVWDGSAWQAAYASLIGLLQASNNLSDLNSASTARSNLGLGSAATTPSSAYATAAQGGKADTALQPANLVTQSTADWILGTSTDEGIVSPAKMKAAFDEFSSGYESSQFTPSSSTTTTLAHGLGATPNIVFKVIICTTAEYGFSVGDKILLGPTSTFMDANEGSTAQVDATNIKVHFASLGLEKIINPSGSRENLSYGNWDMIVRAYL